MTTYTKYYAVNNLPMITKGKYYNVLTSDLYDPMTFIPTYRVIGDDGKVINIRHGKFILNFISIERAREGKLKLLGI